MMNITIISSRNPNETLFECIRGVQKYYPEFDIVVIDSDSESLEGYDYLKKFHPNVKVVFAKNKNYEFGAWKIGYEMFPLYQTYMCIQDSLIPNIRMNIEENKTYTIWHESGFHSHPNIKNLANDLIKHTIYENIFKERKDDHFCLATHSSFITNNLTLKFLVETLINLPTNKDGSCSYERILGLAFSFLNKRPIDMGFAFNKIHGRRS